MNDNALIADIEGYAAVYDEADLNGDVIAPGAFAASLRANPTVRMLYQHAAEAPIGRWLSFREDAHGLFVTGELILSSPRAREVHALVVGGALDGLSIGYQTTRAARRPGGGRKITLAQLWEVSIVTFPMAPTARITHVGAPRTKHGVDEIVARLKQSVASPTRMRRHASTESAVRSAGRAPASPPQASPEALGAGARDVADALRSAAQNLLV